MEQTKTKKRNWEELINESDTKVAHELWLTYQEGNIEELGKALKLNYENSISGAELDLLTHLSKLMENIILLKLADEYKTQEQWETICDFRDEIEEDLEWNDCLTENSIRRKWERALDGAKYLASTFVDVEQLDELTWTDVFETSYHPSNYGK